MRWIMPLMLASLLVASVDVHRIADKIDALAADVSLNAEPGYSVYDPFLRARPLLAKKSEAPTIETHKPIRVETIFNNQAWVDGKWVRKGSVVHGAQVIEVKKNAMIVAYDDKEILIPVSGPKTVLEVKESKK